MHEGPARSRDAGPSRVQSKLPPPTSDLLVAPDAPMRLAHSRHRAAAAVPHARGADEGAELHESLVVPRAAAGAAAAPWIVAYHERDV